MTDFYLDSDIGEIADGISDPAGVLAGRTLVVTGAAGFLGRYILAVIRRLNASVLTRPCRVLALDNMITGSGDGVEEDDNIRFLAKNVIEPFEPDTEVDYIIHAAGIASPFHYRAYPLETLEVAITGTRNMLELAHRHHARLLFFSSSEIYGDPDAKHVPTPESYRGNVACQGPRACYDESKRVGETLCHIFHAKYGVSTSVVRPFNVYGPGMAENDYRVLANFASRIKAGMPLNVYGSGRQTRTYCYIADAMRGFLLTLLSGVPGEAYNIGATSPEISVNDLVKRIEAVLGRPLDANIVEYPDSYPGDEPQRRCPDIRRARTQLGFAPGVELDDGLGRFLGWTDQAYTGGG